MTATNDAGRSHGSLEACVRVHALQRPDAPALLATGRPACTYRELAAHLERLRPTLTEVLPAGNAVIAVAAAHGPDSFTAIVAAMSGGICAPFDPNRPPAEIAAFLADIMPSLVLVDEDALVRHRDIFTQYGVGIVRMVVTPNAPAGVFDVRIEEPGRRRSGAPAYADDVALLLRTSGTTATSKIVPHTTPRIMHAVSSVARAMGFQPADRCLNTLPLHHAYAITGVCGASIFAGASIICPATISAQALVDALLAYDPTWYTAAPPMHRDVLAHLRRSGSHGNPSLRFARTAGAPIDAQLVLDLEAHLGVPILDGYGATEAPSSAFNLPESNRHGSVGRAVGCEIAILDGEVAIRGVNVAPAYADVDRTPIADPDTRWYHTGDSGYLDADGYLYITGRLNELINVGGEKVAPGQIEQTLRAHPAVADAAAFPLSHPTLGQHVAAAVVPHANAMVTERELIEHAAQRLPRAAVPNVVHRVDAIPRDGNGKVRRRELSETFARNARSTPRDSNHTPENALLDQLAQIWRDVLECGSVALDENFFAAGGDSLRALRVMTRIEDELGVTLADDTLLFAPTIRELAQAVRTAAHGTQRERIVPLRSSGSRPPLFFYSDLSGSILYARFLPAAFDPEQPVYLIRPHGALGDPLPDTIDAMAAADAATILATVPSQTYRLAGFCAGATVAFEVARRLEEAGSTVDVLALIATAAPNAGLEPLWALASRLGGLLSPRNVVRVYKALRAVANAVRNRAFPAEVSNTIYYLRHPLEATPGVADFSSRLIRHFPKPTSLTVDLIWAEGDRPVLLGDPSMGFGRLARVRRHTVRGDHTSVLGEHVGELGTLLRRIVDAADG